MKRNLILAGLLLTICTGIFSQFGTDTASYCLKRAYLELSSRHMYGINHWIFGDCRADNSEVGGEGPYDNQNLQELMLYNYLSTNTEITNTWYRAYNIIFFCDRTMEFAPTVGLEESVKDQYIAEAKFIQSLMLFELAINYDSIQIYDDFSQWTLTGSFDDYFAFNRTYTEPSTIAEVFSKIETDVTEAIDNLPLRSELSAEDRFRATKGAANALLVKMYIFQSSYAKNYPGDERFSGLTEQWGLALQYAEEVINSAEYELVGINSETYNTWWDNSYLYPLETPGYRYIFTADGNDSPESVFAAKNLIIGEGWKPYGGNPTTAFTTCRNYFDGAISNFYGWGFNVPSQSLIDEFREESGTASDDPRLPATAAVDSDSIYVYDGISDNQWMLMDFSGSATNMYCRKYECSPDEYWLVFSNWSDSPLNIHVIRYGDVILWAAEAALELGQNVKALGYINMVRTRARNSGSTGYPANLVSVTLDDIIHERCLELALEGHRFYDLVRWNIADEKLDGLYNETFDQVLDFVPGRDEFFPIPLSTIHTGMNNKNIQNIDIMPNPAKEFIKIDSELKDVTVTIYDIYGKTLLKDEARDGSVILNIEYLKAGLYFIALESNEIKIVDKFIKE